MFKLFRKPKPGVPKPSLDDVDLNLESIAGSIEILDTLPRIHWPAVQSAAKPYADHPALGDIWSVLAMQWLDVLRRNLTEPYEIYESDRLLLLSAQGPGEATRLLKIGDYAYDRLERLVERDESRRGFGKHVVLIFKTRREYYDYISYFYPQREQAYGTSSGIHVSTGYRHTTINGASNSIHRTLIHELAHDMVYDRPLPRWLDEGLAQFAEDMVPGYRAPLVNARDVRLHKRYWSWFGMDHFWSGKSFSGVGSQRLSYQLAEILFRNLATDRKRSRRLAEFLANATKKDSGAGACRDCFGCSLSTLLKEFLGPGPWEG